MPEDGIPDNLLATKERSPPDNLMTMKTVTSEVTVILFSLVLLEDKAIRSAITGDTLDWPSITSQAINEYSTPHLATTAFPTLFPYGTGDPTNPAHQIKVSLTASNISLSMGKLLMTIHIGGLLPTQDFCIGH